MSKWFKELEFYHKDAVEVKHIKENKSILLYEVFFKDGDAFRGFVIKSMNKTSLVKMDGSKKTWERKMFGYTDRSHKPSWSDPTVCKFDFMSKNLKYLEDAIFVSMI